MATLRTPLAVLAMLALSAGAASAQFPELQVSPRLPTTLDSVEVTVSGTAPCIDVTAEPVRFEGSRIILPILNIFGTVCLPQPFVLTFPLGRLPAGTWTVEAEVDGAIGARRTVDVIPASHDLFLHGDQFRVRVDWSTPDGVLRGTAYGVPLSDDAGYLWFFEGKNPEILIKILDGRPVNGHWWVFISSNTNLELTVRAGKRGPSNPPVYQEKNYVSPAGANKNFIDTMSFGDN